jgi:hypothetical protein
MSDHNLMKEALVKKLGEWVDSAPDPDRQVFLSADGKGTSMRDLLRSVEKGTPEGNEFVQHYIAQFVDFVNSKKTNDSEGV